MIAVASWQARSNTVPFRRGPGALDSEGDWHPQRHEALLRSAPHRYSELVQNVASFGIYLIGCDGRVQSWNQGAQNITGYRERDIVGQPFSALFAEAAAREGVPARSINFARANHHCKDEQLRRRHNGEEYVAESTLDAVRNECGEILGFVEVFHDITEQKQREERLYQRATRDPMTGVFNRGHFTELSTQEIDRARRFAEPLSLIMIDIDHFKKINDSHGHDIGDRAIITLTRVCSEQIRKIDILGRLGGEEFAVVLPRANKEPAFEMAQRLRLTLAAQRMAAHEGEFSLTVSMGLASLRPHTRDLAELLRNADAALYRAKREGRNRVERWFE